MKKTTTVCAVALLAGGATLATTSTASAYDCTTLTNTVYIAGSSASKPFLLALAQALGTGVSLVYAAPTSCLGLADVTASPPQTESSSASYLDPTTGAVEACTSGSLPYPPIAIDIGVSDVFPSTCITPAITLGSSYGEFRGAIQPMEIVVPWASSQSSISADAAYVVFGFAAQKYIVDPWNDPTAIWTRGDTSGTQLMIATAIGLSGDKWLSTLSVDGGAAQILAGSSNMVTAIVNANATKPTTTIGILSAGSADPDRSAPAKTDGGVATGGIKPLAFQANEQECGYYPDSDLSHFDKLNVRQGRYAIWGPLHFVTNVDGKGNPLASPQASGNPVPSTNANVAKVIDAITHTSLTSSSAPTLEQVITAEANSHFVPDCAMQVKRTSEIGAEASYQPMMACGCYYESLIGAGTTVSSYCKTCTTAATDCTDKAYPACNFGYCEAQ
jgi:ABC-type phosphate transport system substrate-binding protein